MARSQSRTGTVHVLSEEGRLLTNREVSAVPTATESDRIIAEMCRPRSNVERMMIQLLSDVICDDKAGMHTHCLQSPYSPDHEQMSWFGLEPNDWDPTLRF